MTNELLKPFDAKAADAAKPVFGVREKSEKAIDALPPSLRALARANNFNGDLGAVLANDEGVILGTGDESDPFAAAAIAEKAPEGDYVLRGDINGVAAEKAAFGFLLGAYRFDRYKKQKRAKARLIAPAGVDVDRVRRLAAATALTRDLINTPAGDMTPSALEAAARALAKAHDATVSSIIGDELSRRDFPMIHAVGRAAVAAPRLIDVVFGDADAPKVTVVGKGVCFDSGGLDLKNADSMRLMKKDMGGAATALGLAALVMGEKLPVRLRVLIPAVENAVAGDAFRPGDILPTRKGLSVEIANTDAEGRLILADALSLGAEESPQMLITLATLTGAARTALGPDLPPFFCTDEALAADIAAAAEAASDPVWRMPFWSGYEHMLTSPVADLNNSPTGPFAGSITAALFLKRFAPASIPYAHFDIYAWRSRALPGRPIGGEAQAMRALFEMLRRRYA
ncbi:MAG: leucyl aminopeptidase family protein [Parvularculaceae bacterium]|jgi:leucyl aminopeptidase|nr:leucyl aminopeptidase family protein [Parvularculaceae bacterium]